jgi:hypothetical protein
MEKLPRKGHSFIIAQIHSIQEVETPFVHLYLQYIFSQHQAMFQTPHGVHDHSIPLVLGNIPPNVFPYHHPFTHKNEIEKIVQ